MKKVNLIAAIVTFNPDKNIVSLVNFFRNKEIDIIVIDNSCVKNDYILKISEDVVLMQDMQNKGLAKALNIALEYAISNNYEYMFTFDQDSLPIENYVENMFLTKEAYLKDYNAIPAIIGPSFFDNPSKSFFTERDMSRVYRIVETTMTSGNLLSIDVFKNNNIRFNEKFFIDHVDHEICFHIQKNGYTVLESEIAVLNHNLGDKITIKFFGKFISVYNHSVFRQYYIYRNFIWLWKLYYSLHKTWFRKSLIRLSKRFVKIILFENKKIEKVSSIVRGIKDGIKNA